MDSAIARQIDETFQDKQEITDTPMESPAETHVGRRDADGRSDTVMTA